MNALVPLSLDVWRHRTHGGLYCCPAGQPTNDGGVWQLIGTYSLDEETTKGKVMKLLVEVDTAGDLPVPYSNIKPMIGMALGSRGLKFEITQVDEGDARLACCENRILDRDVEFYISEVEFTQRQLRSAISDTEPYWQQRMAAAQRVAEALTQYRQMIDGE